MRCTVKDCRQPRTLFKGSDKCADHTCHTWECKTIKPPENQKYCDGCRCTFAGGCQNNKSYQEQACYLHACRKFCKRPMDPSSDEKCCLPCSSTCDTISCGVERHPGSKFCKKHSCAVEGCGGQVAKSGWVWQEFCNTHRCRKCSGLKTTPGIDYCGACLQFCVLCRAPRPATHEGILYYCDQHGCLQCHAEPKHRYVFLREEATSEFCERHFLCARENCRWPRLERETFCRRHSHA